MRDRAEQQHTAGGRAERGAREPASRAGAGRLLEGGSARLVLARIFPGDALGLRGRVSRRLRERALLLDPERVHLRALARCALAAASRRGPASGGLASWLTAHLERAADEVLREDEQALRAGAARPGSTVELAGPLGFEPRTARAITGAFHGCAEADRIAFYQLAIDGAPIDPGDPGDRARARAARGVLDACLAAGPDAPRTRSTGPNP